MAYENKTKKTKAKVRDYVASLKDENARKEAKRLLALFKEVTGVAPALWGPSIVGYGSYHYKGRSAEGDWPRTGFSMRASGPTLYIMLGVKNYPELLKKLGPHKTGSSCLYLKRLSDIHLPTLRTLLKKSLADMKKKYP